MDYDRFSRNDPIGEIYVPLHTITLSDEYIQFVNLTPCRGSNKRGELLLSLCYQPLEGILDVEILKGKNLKPMDLNGTSDPYAKIWLIYRGKKIEKKKTSVQKNTLNPEFREEFTFNAPMDRLRDMQLEITVMDHDVIGRNDTIGKIYLGHKSGGLEKQHWKDMLTNSRKPCSQWHVLKV
uniref:C2 domain-containing protein n=1 Tax=Ciona savignyi TaxID=51511 RepID=H2YLQ3_CIOSA